MAASEGKAPILESAAAGVAFLRNNWRFALIVALAASAVSVAISLLAVSAPAAFPLFAFLQYAVLACVYAALLRLAMGEGPIEPNRTLADGARLLAAMAVIAFFLMIVCVVALLPSAVILSVALAPFQTRIEAMGPNPRFEDLSGVMTEAFTADPYPFLIVFALYILAWLFLTSRLYLAAPATVANGRILTFDTWSWTKGAMWRIVAARLVLLIPAAIIVLAIQRFTGAALGVNTFDFEALAAYAHANPLGAAAIEFVGDAAQYFILVTLEAGLSAYLYQGLKGAVRAKP